MQCEAAVNENLKAYIQMSNAFDSLVKHWHNPLLGSSWQQAGAVPCIIRHAFNKQPGQLAQKQAYWDYNSRDVS